MSPDYGNRLPSRQVSADQTVDVLVIRSVAELERTREQIISRSKCSSTTQRALLSLLREQEPQREEKDWRLCLCKGLFAFNFSPWAKAESQEKGWGRLNIKKIRDDKYLYLSIWVLPDLIQSGVPLMSLRAQSKGWIGWFLTELKKNIGKQCTDILYVVRGY